ncbi:hypothetical protein [Neolewinella agarilytica]|uniref:Outer membrane protein beta-barrel domain-containing protein n=1 Tax=Neolewinella agarilytica TaxID=478744 RepID=A0A1H9I3E7_9BACT|nr:hypothetical protein [Neolewinella agarilytica]SEQ69022.1 hypothetical protein SAMN05444359_11421 [Neolewinella agarilytica]
MSKSVVSLLFLLLISAYVSGQTDNRLSVEVQGSIGSYTTFSDFQEIVYTIEGQNYNRSNGNVTESDIVPYLSLGLNYQLTERLQLAPFVHYLFGKGTLYENDFVIFGVSDVNPVEQIFEAPADNEIEVLTAGVNVRYRLISLVGSHLYFGTGLAYATRSHFYRHEMDVDFGADRIAQSVDERFTTEKKSAVFIPVSAGLERAVSDRLTLTLNVQGFISPETEDRAWSAGLGLRYGW